MLDQHRSNHVGVDRPILDPHNLVWFMLLTRTISFEGIRESFYTYKAQKNVVQAFATFFSLLADTESWRMSSRSGGCGWSETSIDTIRNPNSLLK